MSGVEAIRSMASEHNLEFVDLDTYGVDPVAGSLLAADIAQRHRIVAVKRKFGTPVIASAEPLDLVTQDAVRAALGRDFIAVMAAPHQIEAWLHRLYGGGLPGPPPVPGGQLPPAALTLPGALELPTMPSFGTSLPGVSTPAVMPGMPTGLAATPAPLPTAVPPTYSAPSAQAVPAPAAPAAFPAAPQAFPTTPASTPPPAAVPMPPATMPDPLAALAAEVGPDSLSAFDNLSAEVSGLGDVVGAAVASYEEMHAEDVAAPAPAVPEGDPLAGFPFLAVVLVQDGRVSIDAMRSVVEESMQVGESIARILTNRKLVTEADLMWGMAQELGLEFVDLDLYSIDLALSSTLPESTARHHNVMVINQEDGISIVASANPSDVFAKDDLRTILGSNFRFVVATHSQINAYVNRAFSSNDAADMAMEVSMGIEVTTQDSPDEIGAITEEAPIVRYVNLLILQALNERASDIHVEPSGAELRIRYRIDGVLHDVSTAPRAIAPAVTTRLKVMADMNVAEKRVPQDGRISLNVGNRGIDLRMATLPTIHGEKVVMRVLDKSTSILGFEDMGFEPELMAIYERMYTKPYGTILVTGPTGSGKSTTLYATLSALNSPEKNIITVEDPVELQLAGVNQVQINNKAGLTFASALKSILRSDPDIVLVGEIRDRETAVIAIEAALTGHMVLATLHTNSAAATPMRLVEMGIEPFLVTSSLLGVVAQRLARRLCPHCKEQFAPTEADIVSAGWTLVEVESMGGLSSIYRSVGCSACGNTGYRGRKALVELLTMTEEVERMIIEGGSVDEIQRLAMAQGMRSLRQNGLKKAIEGETTLEEVLRVVA